MSIGRLELTGSHNNQLSGIVFSLFSIESRHQVPLIKTVV